MSHDFDLFVIGGGSGGVRAGRVAAQRGARVAITEMSRYGGTCVIRGCVPKKLFVFASEYRPAFEDAAAFGWTLGEPTFDWQVLVANKDKTIDRLNATYIRMLDNAGAQVMHGRARLVDAHTVEVTGAAGETTRHTAGHILIATGGFPTRPPFPGADLALVSDDAFHLPELPRRVAVGGGGYIAVEFAHILRGLGCEVTLIHRGSRVLRGFDTDVRDAVMRGLDHHGIATRMDTTVASLSATPQGDGDGDGARAVALSSGETLEVDALLCAMGRTPSTRDIGLEDAGVKLRDSGAVMVDDYSKTSVDHIYAVGDCTDRVNLTPVAIREGQAFVDTVFSDAPTPVDHDCIPTAVFSQPPVATVGLTEAEARDKLRSVDIYRSSFRPLRHSLTRREEMTMMKLVVDGDTQKVVGLHMVGHDGPEIVQAAAIAVRMGATKADFDNTCAIHPTTAEELVLMRTKVQ